jgi:FkbM family methyltransferase
MREKIRARLGQTRAELRRQNEGLKADSAELRERLVRRDARVTALKANVDLLRQQIHTLDRRLNQRRRSALSADLLQVVLQTRAAHPGIDAYTAAAAMERERRFVEGSDAYRALVDDAAARTAGLECLTIDGLEWWVPLDERLPQRAERTRDQGFPYRVLLQTREVAVGGVMLDLGGNIGRTSVTRGLLGDARAVYAAEPEPLNYAALLQNVLAHGMRGIVLPDQVAVGGERGEVRLLRSRFMGGHRVLVQGTDERGAQVVTVPCWPVDEWLDRVGCDPGAVTFVKVDVQGSEIGILRGAAGLLALRQAAWQFEVDPLLLGKAGHTVDELFTAFETHFTHYVDMNPDRPGDRVSPIGEMRERLAYVGVEQDKTDLMLIPAGPSSGGL